MMMMERNKMTDMMINAEQISIKISVGINQSSFDMTVELTMSIFN